jgi:serine/threonine protein phosphatase 1
MPPHITVPGRTLIVGDLHGCLGQLQAALARLAFDPAAGDRLCSVGDLIDRGPDSPGCLALLDQPWFHAVLGNHEAMLLDALTPEGLVGAGRTRHHAQERARWRRNGGDWFDELSPAAQDTIRGRLPQLARLPLALTLTTALGRRIGLVHADPVSHDWAKLDATFMTRHRRDMLWERSRLQRLQRDLNQPPQWIANVSLVVMGHTPLEHGWLRHGNLCWIDTGAVYGGELTLLEPDTLTL